MSVAERKWPSVTVRSWAMVRVEDEASTLSEAWELLMVRLLKVTVPVTV